MLTVIVVSNRKDNFNEFQKNIGATIGVPFQLLTTDRIEKGIAGAYNQLASHAIHDFLCFVHDDVRFQTAGWGERLLHHLQDESTGVVGVAGGRYKSAFGLDWKDGARHHWRARIRDGDSDFYFNPFSEQASEVVCLDGLLLACRKAVWHHQRFDERFKGFHFYDADFTFGIRQRFRNFVVYDIYVEHFSRGNLDRHFLTDSLLFDKKWEGFLPASCDPVTLKAVSGLEGYMVTKKLVLMRQHRFPVKERAKLLVRYLKRHKNPYQLMRNLYFGFLKS